MNPSSPCRLRARSKNMRSLSRPYRKVSRSHCGHRPWPSGLPGVFSADGPHLPIRQTDRYPRTRCCARRHLQNAGCLARVAGPACSDFIDKYIFPDGEIPHLWRVVQDMAGQDLEVLDVENNLHPHRAGEALTPRHWERRYQCQKDRFRLAEPDWCDL